MLAVPAAPERYAALRRYMDDDVCEGTSFVCSSDVEAEVVAGETAVL
jgi:hypothetical protein